MKLHVHHIKFKSEGGTDTPDNLITLCELCHESLHASKLDSKVHEKLKKKTHSKTKHATEMGIIKSQLKKSDWEFIETFGYETKLKRESLGLPKTHYNDAVAICLTEGQSICHSNSVIIKKHIANGDYQQTAGRRSEERIPTGKIMGFKKFDKVLYTNQELFIKGRMSTGYAILMDIEGHKIDLKPLAKLSKLIKISARKSCLITQMIIENLN